MKTFSDRANGVHTFPAVWKLSNTSDLYLGSKITQPDYPAQAVVSFNSQENYAQTNLSLEFTSVTVQESSQASCYRRITKTSQRRNP